MGPENSRRPFTVMIKTLGAPPIFSPPSNKNLAKTSFITNSIKIRSNGPNESAIGLQMIGYIAQNIQTTLLPSNLLLNTLEGQIHAL